MVVAIKEIMASEKEKRNQLLNDLRTFLTGEMCSYLVKFYGCYYHAGLVKQVIEYMNLGSLRNIVNLVVKKKLFIQENDLREIIRSVHIFVYKDLKRIVSYSQDKASNPSWYQAIKHPHEWQGRNKDLGLWCCQIHREHIGSCKHICEHRCLHVRISYNFIGVPKDSECRVSTIQNAMYGEWV